MQPLQSGIISIPGSPKTWTWNQSPILAPQITDKSQKGTQSGSQEPPKISLKSIKMHRRYWFLLQLCWVQNISIESYIAQRHVCMCYVWKIYVSSPCPMGCKAAHMTTISFHLSCGIRYGRKCVPSAKPVLCSKTAFSHVSCIVPYCTTYNLN